MLGAYLKFYQRLPKIHGELVKIREEIAANWKQLVVEGRG